MNWRLFPLFASSPDPVGHYFLKACTVFSSDKRGMISWLVLEACDLKTAIDFIVWAQVPVLSLLAVPLSFSLFACLPNILDKMEMFRNLENTLFVGSLVKMVNS